MKVIRAGEGLMTEKVRRLRMPGQIGSSEYAWKKKQENGEIQEHLKKCDICVTKEKAVFLFGYGVKKQFLKRPEPDRQRQAAWNCLGEEAP